MKGDGGNDEFKFEYEKLHRAFIRSYAFEDERLFMTLQAAETFRLEDRQNW